MLKEERHQFILQRLKLDFKVRVTTLSKEMGISDDTIRRDLEELGKNGQLTRVHGGAIAKSGIPLEFADRQQTDVAEKQALAHKAISLFKADDILLIDGGTTNLELVKKLPRDFKLTVYTNSFPVAQALMGRDNIDLVFLGGPVFKISQVAVGIPVFQALQFVIPDWLVLGVSNVHPQKGITAPDREEALLKRAMVERSKQKVILVDNHKINTAESYTVCSLNDIDYMVVEEGNIHALKMNWKNDVQRLEII